jgi:hypothetical protein
MSFLPMGDTTTSPHGKHRSKDTIPGEPGPGSQEDFADFPVSGKREFFCEEIIIHSQ